MRFCLAAYAAMMIFVSAGATARAAMDVSPALDVNLLVNPGFEEPLTTGWTSDLGSRRSDNPAPHGGSWYLSGGLNNAASRTWQRVDLLDHHFDIFEIDDGRYQVLYGGWQAGWNTQTDRGRIELTFLDEADQPIGTDDLGWFFSNHTWTLRNGALPLPAGTRAITYAFSSQRYEGSNNDGYLDDAFLIIAVPEPATLALLGLGTALTFARAARRKGPRP